MRDAGAVSAETLQGSLANVAINVETVMDVLPENPADSGDIGAVADALETTTETMAGTFVDLSSGRGEAFRCAVTQLGSVYCWGSNAWANLGDPAAFKDDKGAYHKDGSAVKDLFSYLPVQVRQPYGSPLTGISEVEVGSRFACAVAMDGGVWCWGDNYYGQTGTGKLGDDSRYVYGATRVVAGEQKDGDYLGNVVSISLSRNSACALTISGQAFCWGDNTSKQLGADLPDHDNYKAFASVTMSDGTNLPESEGFALKAVPYPVAVTIPGSLGLTALAAGDWAFCALADVSSATDKHNLFCWGNDSTGLFHNFNDYLPRDPESKDIVLDEELQKQFAKVEYYEALSNSSADSSGDYLEEGKNWICVNDKTGENVAPAVVNNFARGKNPDALHEFASYQRAELSSRDWLIQDSNGDYHPLYSTAVTRIDRAWETAVYGQDLTKFAEYHSDVTKDDDGKVTGGFRELESLTDVAFGASEDEKGFTALLGGYVGSLQAHDAELTVGFLSGENDQKYKRWHRLSRGSRYLVGTVRFTCSYIPSTDDCPHDPAYCGVTKSWDSGYEQYVLSSGQFYNNNRTVVYDTVYMGETGEPEFMSCTYDTKKGKLVISDCQEGIDRFDGEGVYTEDDETIKISTNAQSTCTLTEPSEDADSNISCSGYNTFGQAGYEPGLIKTCTDSSCQSYKDISYTGVSYSDYVSAWKWALPKSALIMSHPDTEQAAVRSELLTYFDHFNLGKAWATLSCGAITTDDPLTVDEQNDASCNGVHGDELRNQILENAMTEAKGTNMTYPVVIISGSQDQ